MIRDDLIGEFSARLERLQAATPGSVTELADLRCQVEMNPAASLAAEFASALALADRLCWDSLLAGDIDAFARQAPVSADLRLFGVCAQLMEDHLIAVAQEPDISAPSQLRPGLRAVGQQGRPAFGTKLRPRLVLSFPATTE